MIRVFKRSNGRLYLEYKAYGKTVQKSTKLLDTPKNRLIVEKEIIPPLQLSILRGDFNGDKPREFSYYSFIYLDRKRNLKSYKRLQKHISVINEYFGDMLISKIRRSDIKNWINMKLDELSSKTIKNYLSSIRGVFLIAIDLEVISENIVKDIELPKHYIKTVEPFSINEVNLLLSNANEFYKLYLYIAFYTGMRRGEILGLQWSDIDFDKKCIYINRAVTDGVVTTPKTDNSIRVVPLFDELLMYLHGKKNNSIWLFPGINGDYLKSFSGTRKREWKILLEKSNIRYRKLYTTRHTFIVTMLKKSDLSVLEIAQIVGHTTTQMIIHHYAKYIDREHLKIDRSLDIFTDKSTDI